MYATLLTYDGPSGPAPAKPARSEKDILKLMKRRHAASYKLFKDDGWHSHLKEVMEYIFPRRGRFLCDNPKRGRKVNQSVLTHAPIRAATRGAAGLSHAITPKSSVWFNLTLKNRTLADRRDVRVWLAECEDLLRQWLDSSNFYTALRQIYLELIVFGTATMITVEDFETLVHCEVLTIGEYTLTQDRRGRVNGLFRTYEATVENAVDEFGVDKVSRRIADAYKAGGEKLDDKVVICHHIGPNPDADRQMPGSHNMPYRSCYWERDCEDKFLKYSGFEENPIQCARWEAMGGEVYSRSPGMEALPECKQLKLAITRKAQGIDRAVVPPMKAPVALKNAGANLLPGAINFVDDATNEGAGFESLFKNYNPRLEVIREEIAELIKIIEQCFYNDVFMPITSMQGVQPRNEMELWRRIEEMLSQLGPMSEAFETDFLERFFERAWAIAARNGMLPPAPADIADRGEAMELVFTGPLAAAQKASSISSMERAIAFIGNLAQSFPSAGDKLDTDKAIDRYTDMLNSPPSIIRSDEDAAKLRAARLEKEQMAQAVAAAPAYRDVAAGAKLLSETDTGGGRSALQAAA